MSTRIRSKAPRWLLLLLVLLVVAIVAAPISAQTSIDSTRFTEIYEDVSPSVVAISVVSRGASQFQQRSFGQGPDVPQQASSGSGFVIDTQGNIVTNFHVVDGASSIEVEFFDGTLARAEVIGLDPDSDLAVIKVENVSADHLHPVVFGDSEALDVGETVLAIGSPFGERWTLTSGIVSALDRTIQGMTQFSIGGVIQTDAAINPGNSGGPLLNMAGEVIGVNSQIISATRSNAGVGFAIPSNLTQRVSGDLVEQGFVQYSYIGLSGGNVSLDLLEALNLPNNTRGVVVSDVSNGSPAARAGVASMGPMMQSDTGQQVPQSVDIITAINGTPLNGIEALISYLARNTRPGDTITLSVLRDGTDTIELPVRLIPRP